MNHVVCVKWGNKYISKYANVLNNMVKRHTTVPYQFHCLTDDPTGLDPDINVIRLPKDPWIKSWWSKLWMFAPEMPVKGNILFFDLDVVIFDNIDPLFSHTGKFNIIQRLQQVQDQGLETEQQQLYAMAGGHHGLPMDGIQRQISTDHATESR
jgi:hypothetical protein